MASAAAILHTDLEPSEYWRNDFIPGEALIPQNSKVGEAIPIRTVEFLVKDGHLQSNLPPCRGIAQAVQRVGDLIAYFAGSPRARSPRNGRGR